MSTRDDPKRLTRAFAVALDRAALDARAEGDDRIPIAISSEHEVARWDFWTGERYVEVLDHGSKAIDLTRAAEGLPFLVDHDTREQVGIVEDVALGEGRKLRGVVRFSRSQRGQEIRQDMLDGIRKNVSVGYSVSDDYEQEKRGDVVVRRYRQWTPYEASSVPIPADPTVGVGRSAQSQSATAPTSSAAVDTAKENRMSEQDKAAAASAAVEVRERAERSAPETPKHDPAAQIMDACEAAGLTVKEARELAASGKSFREISDIVVGKIQAREQGKTQATPRVALTEKEEKEYSFSRAILAQTDGTACFEREVSQEIEKNLPQGYKPNGGFYVLTNVRNHFTAEQRERAVKHLMQRAGLDSGTSTKGAELKFTQAGSFIEMLRNASRVIQAGATILPGLDGPVSFPKQNGAGTFSWVAENPGSDVADSNLTLTSVSLAAKTGMSTTSFSRQLLRQAQTVDVESLVRADLAAIHGLGIDAAALYGTGASNQPTGIYVQSGTNVIAIGTNGGAPTYTHAVQMGVVVEQANAADLGAAALITTPGIKGTLKLTQKFASTNGDPVWGDDNKVAGMSAYSSNQVQSNLTKGTGTSLHAMYAGVWSQLLIGEFGAMEILTDPYRLKKQGMIEVTSFQMIDVAVRYAPAFAIVKDAISLF